MKRIIIVVVVAGVLGVASLESAIMRVYNKSNVGITVWADTKILYQGGTTQKKYIPKRENVLLEAPAGNIMALSWEYDGDSKTHKNNWSTRNWKDTVDIHITNEDRKY